MSCISHNAPVVFVLKWTMLTDLHVLFFFFLVLFQSSVQPWSLTMHCYYRMGFLVPKLSLHRPQVPSTWVLFLNALCLFKITLKCEDSPHVWTHKYFTANFRQILSYVIWSFNRFIEPVVTADQGIKYGCSPFGYCHSFFPSQVELWMLDVHFSHVLRYVKVCTGSSCLR